jgi:hypothetical protein
MTGEPGDEFPLRYAVLWHDGIAHPHYDLLFETAPGSPLASWRCDSWPPEGGELTALPPHRRRYLTYEGPIEGDRGRVRRVAEGHHQLRIDGDRVILCTQGGVVIDRPASEAL